MPVSQNLPVTVVVSVPPTRVSGQSPVRGDVIDVRQFGPGARFLLTLAVFETDKDNVGGKWSVVESARKTGSWKPATVSGSLAATGPTAGCVTRLVQVTVNPAAPFVRPVFTGSGEKTEVDVSATCVIAARGRV